MPISKELSLLRSVDGTCFYFARGDEIVGKTEGSRKADIFRALPSVVTVENCDAEVKGIHQKIATLLDRQLKRKEGLREGASSIVASEMEKVLGDLVSQLSGNRDRKLSMRSLFLKDPLSALRLGQSNRRILRTLAGGVGSLAHATEIDTRVNAGDLLAGEYTGRYLDDLARQGIKPPEGEIALRLGLLEWLEKLAAIPTVQKQLAEAAMSAARRKAENLKKIAHLRIDAEHLPELNELRANVIPLKLQRLFQEAWFYGAGAATTIWGFFGGVFSKTVDKLLDTGASLPLSMSGGAVLGGTVGFALGNPGLGAGVGLGLGTFGEIIFRRGRAAKREKNKSSTNEKEYSLTKTW